MNNRQEEDWKILWILAIMAVFMIAITVSYFFSPPPPPPKSIEQIRAERHERFHEAGKSVNEFARGALGLEQKKEAEKK